jgi:IMP dehydrogenase
MLSRAAGGAVRPRAPGTPRRSACYGIVESGRGRRGTSRYPRLAMSRLDDIPLGLSYDDVLLVPQRGSILSRSDTDLRSRLTPRIDLSVPVVSANMDTVTEARMAIAMARAGGIGVVHRFLTVEQQVDEVARVKRAEALVILDPHTISGDATLARARAEMESRGVSGLVVIGDDGRVEGILTSRDVILRDDDSVEVRALMTPRERLVTAPPGTSTEAAAELLRDNRVEKLPLVDDDGRLTGLITLRDLLQRVERPQATKDARGRLAVGAAIGVRGDYLERAKALADAGADVLVLDIAHGHAERALAAIGEVREFVGEVEIIAGNVATAQGALDLVAAGADAVKVGVGPGSVCTTRVVAGVGVPQFSAVLECAEALAPLDIPVIADGGIRAGGDVAKAIGAGASTVMVGNLLAGTPESPGVVVSRKGQRVKVFRGMASGAAADARRTAEGDAGTDFTPAVAEGVEAVVPVRDDAATVVAALTGGLRSGMSYSNAHTIPEMQENARFVRITPGGLRESYPHDVTL